jgi:APA family basic amino acid/polyamine antiporter
MTEESSPSASQQLQRTVGLPGAVLLGLGSILGTGVFVSLTMVADLAADWTVLAILVAGALAVCNGLSSAQLAAAHPISGGTYEYGYRYLNPAAGFTAGWMFLVAKSASAATAALGIAHYINAILPSDREVCPILTGAIIVIFMTAFVLGGLKRSTRLNAILVSLTLAALTVFVINANPIAVSETAERSSSNEFSYRHFFEACALAFVAFTGYGRVATMGEEIRDPARNIPLAILLTLTLTVMLYAAVGWSLSSSGPGVHSLVEHPALASSRVLQTLVAIGAMLAMLGVLLNLILGLSRVLLAMARRRDVPQGLAVLNSTGTSPNRCVIAIGILIAGLCALGDIRMTWSLSAFTVLVYYATANLCAIMQPPAERRYPRGIPIVGFVVCCSLAVWVEQLAWITGLTLIVIGLFWHCLRRRLNDSQ